MLKAKILAFKDPSDKKGFKDMEQKLNDAVQRLEVIDVKVTAVPDYVLYTIIYLR